MHSLEEFCHALQRDDHLFTETLDFIGKHYTFTPSAFDNNSLHNDIEANQGSCRILALGILEGLSHEETLKAFGEHYRGVLVDPDGNSHTNIRRLMMGTLNNVHFTHFPLKRHD